RSTVTNYLRLLKLPPVIQAGIRDGQISMGHARALINVGEVEKQLYVYQEIIDKGLSVRMAEILVRNIQQQSKPKKHPVGKQLDFPYPDLEGDLASKFSTRGRLNRKNSKGKGALEIPVDREDDLGRILELLGW